MYFEMLRWALGMQLLLATIWICFVMIPYALFYDHDADSYLKPPRSRDDADDTIIMFASGGWLLNTSGAFIGHYSKEFKVYQESECSDPNGDCSEPLGADYPGHSATSAGGYDIADWYLAATWMQYGVMTIAILTSLYNAVKNTFSAQEASEGSHLDFTIECVAGHDYTTEGKEANEVHLFAEAKNFRSLLNEDKRARELSKKDWNVIYRVRVYVNITVLAIIIGCGCLEPPPLSSPSTLLPTVVRSRRGATLCLIPRSLPGSPVLVGARAPVVTMLHVSILRLTNGYQVVACHILRRRAVNLERRVRQADPGADGGRV